MRIISAKDYGFRTVIRVTDSSGPEWVHADGQAHSQATAVGPSVTAADGTVTPGKLDPALEAGTECHACRSNWKVREFIIQGAELYQDDGTTRRTPPQIMALVKARLETQSEVVVRTISDLVGKDVA